VSKPSDNSNFQQLDGAVARELHDLCTRLYDQVITVEELAELNQLLDSSPAARQFYLRYVSLHSMLLTNAGKHRQVEAEVLGRHVAAFAENDETVEDGSYTALLPKADSGSRWFPRKSWAAIAASLFIVTVTTLWAIRASNDQVEIASKGVEVPALQPAASNRVEQRVSVTRLSYISPAVRWLQPNDAFLPKSIVPVGSVLALAEGEIELTYSTGTKLLLIGPAEFLLEESGGKLRRGGLVASVTEEGHGFKIETPNGKIVDLGTEFGVAVDDFGVSEVSVFQGKVEAFPLGSKSNGKKIELTKGHGLQWNQDNLIPLDADMRRFATSVLDRKIPTDQTGGQASLVDRFREAVLNSKKWKALGNVQATTAGLRLLGDSEPGKQSYLVSAKQFDPALGPVTVTCDFQFIEPSSEGTPAFSMLTRSADQRGTALEPWSGTLASGVRCSFGSEGNSKEGLLQAGVKLEADREMVSISWNGFLVPTPGTAYRVVMRDDGVNVSFTVSLRDDLSTSKTVTCRSLFRGKSSFVALEGSMLGTTLIERVEISQDRSTTSLASYADFSSLLLDDHEQQEIEQQQLAALVPSDAVLVLHDDFSDGELDTQKWMSLGEVVMRDGVAQLGMPNTDAHIDTWRARPYLLTREPLDPNAGTLTIIGKISFTDNFLAGYGATFAVMTRADDQRGSGPGWENSVLRRGIRANFWPAAWDTEHSLEIHEKPAANTVTLLATQGVQVDPKARLYLFRVVDYGEFVTLTIVDPRKPEAVMTISSPTTSALKQGFVGFESCWGSPVTLDDVQIYQSKRPTRQSSASTDGE